MRQKSQRRQRYEENELWQKREEEENSKLWIQPNLKYLFINFCDLLINKCVAYWFGNCEFDKFSKSSCKSFYEIKYIKQKEKRI